MKVSANTKISELIKMNPAAVDVIASINSHFGKLKNPFLRKLLAPRVTVEQAASIGKVTVMEFLLKLKEINMDVEFPSTNSNILNIAQEGVNKADIVLDVRPVLAAGKDPLKEILDSVKKLKNSQTFLLINTFEPFPLIGLLGKKGFKSNVVKKGENLVYTYFYKEEKVCAIEVNNSDKNFEEIKKQFEEKLYVLDVRELEMPGPMVKILDELESLSLDKALYVLHKKVPQFLFPELNSRGYSIVYKEEGPANVKLIIYKS